MDVIEELYRQVLSGEKPAPGDLRTRRILLHKAFEHARSPEIDTRREALTLASMLGERDGLEAVAIFLEDAHASLRNEALDIGIAEGKDGRSLVREAAKNADQALALRAIGVLAELKDSASTRTMRDLLLSPNARIRAAAVELLGHLAGPAVLRDVEPLLTDDDPHVAEAARQARARLLGEDPGPPPQAAAPPAKAVEPPEPAFDLPPPEELEPEEPGPEKNDDTIAALRSATSTANEHAASNTAAAPEARQLPAHLEPPPAGGLWEPDQPTAIPGTMPVEALALVRLLGRVTWRDRPRVVDALRQLPTADLAAVVSGYKPGGDPSRGRGVAIAAETMGNTRWSSALRSMLRDPDASVRCCVLIALSGLAGPSLLPQMGRCATAPEPEVRAATAFAIGHAAARLNAPSIAERYLTPLLTDSNPDVAAAAKVASAASTGGA